VRSGSPDKQGKAAFNERNPQTTQQQKSWKYFQYTDMNYSFPYVVTITYRDVYIPILLWVVEKENTQYMTSWKRKVCVKENDVLLKMNYTCLFICLSKLKSYMNNPVRINPRKMKALTIDIFFICLADKFCMCLFPN
jgi:hypothetical protein